MDRDADARLREAIMASVGARAAENGGYLTRAELTAFPVAGETRRLIDTSRGIWNPQDLEATLTVLSSSNGPYADEETTGGLLRYDYRAGSVDGDNRKLRRAMDLGVPLILLRKIATGVFAPVFPVFVIADDTAARQFVLALDESQRYLADPLHPSEPERRYAERVVRQRLHQAEFRARVLRAYETRCAICRLAHGQLLDASHIVEDTEALGPPVVPNGLSLCKIHHAAYDRDLLGISPDRIVHINRKLLAEIDGPMLEHGLKDMHGTPITVPARRAHQPDPERLAIRFDRFRAA